MEKDGRINLKNLCLLVQKGLKSIQVIKTAEDLKIASDSDKSDMAHLMTLKSKIKERMHILEQNLSNDKSSKRY